MRGLFVTGTDTGAGKSVLAAATCAGLSALGVRVAAFKPAVTGLDAGPGEWPLDHELLASAASAGQSSEEIAPYRFGPPASPHVAAAWTARTIDPRTLRADAESAARLADLVVVEGVGGLMVPLTRDYLVRDLAVDLGFPVVIAARPGLGTINHTLLTVEAARAAGVEVAGVVMTPWPRQPSALEASNRETVEALTASPVSGLPPVTPAGLAQGGAALPLEDWLERSRSPARDLAAPLVGLA